MPRAIKPPPTHVDCPFKIIACSNENAVYNFRNINRTVTYRGERIKVPVVVEVVREALWAHDLTDIEVQVGNRMESFRTGLADYCIANDHYGCQIERKSHQDIFGSLGGRRSKFEAEIKRLNRDCKVAYLMLETDLPQILAEDGVESRHDVAIPVAKDVAKHSDSTDPLADLFRSIPTPHFSPEGDFLDDVNGFDENELEFMVNASPSFGNAGKSHGVSAATVIGTWKSWSQKYRNVHWCFASNRSMAERMTFELLMEYWEKKQEGFWDTK